MKNFFYKTLLFAAFAPAVVMFASCGEDDDNKEEEQPVVVDNRANVVGSYPVKVSVSLMEMEFYTSLTIAKEGEENLKGATKFDLEGVGSVDIAVMLSSLSEFSETGGAAVTGYMYKIEEQDITVLGQSMTCKGTGAFEGGYDGTVYKNSSEAYIALEIEASGMIIKIESGDQPVVTDELAEFLGNYDCSVQQANSAENLDSQSTVAIARLTTGETVEDGTLAVMGEFTSGDSDVFSMSMIITGFKEYSVGSYNGYLFTVSESKVMKNGSEITFSGAKQFENEADGLLLIGENSSRQLILLGTLEGDTQLRVLSHDAKEACMNFTVLTNISGGSIDQDYDAYVTIISDGGEGFSISTVIDASDIGAGEIRIHYNSDNSAPIYAFQEWDVQSFFKDVIYTIDMSSTVTFGNFGSFEFESLGRYYYDLFGYEVPFDIEIKYQYEFPQIALKDFYFFFALFGEVPGFENGEEMLIGFEDSNLQKDSYTLSGTGASKLDAFKRAFRSR